MQRNIQELNVLIIEDNPGDAYLIQFYLGESASPGFTYNHAERISDAYKLLDENSYDIILMDLHLPDSSGTDTLKNLLERYPGNLVLVMTGLTDEEVGLETVRYGAQDFLVKGRFDGKVLISTIMFAFERFKLNKKIHQIESEIYERKQRFDVFQNMVEAGFFEYGSRGEKIMLSSFSKMALGMETSDYFFTDEELQPYIANINELKNTLREKLNSDDAEVNFEIKTLSGNSLHLRLDKLDKRLMGVMRIKKS